MRGTSTGLKLFVYVVTVVMIVPILITFPVAVTTTGYLTFPPVGFTMQWFSAAFTDVVLVQSLVRSVTLALVSAFFAVVVALLAAFAVHRGRVRGTNVIETLFTSPKMVPQIIFVLALLVFYEAIGLAETFTGLVLSHLVVTIPFAFRTVLVNVASLDRRLEWSAEILGASRTQTFLRVILPQLKTGLIAAYIFSFITSFTNVTLALFLSGIGERTLPVEMFQRMYVGGINPTIPALSFILAVAGLVLFIVADRTVGVFKYLGGGGD